MSVMLKLNNVIFKNDNLPTTPLIIQEGLVGAYSLGGSFSKSKYDLSGNMNNLVQYNEVEYTSYSAIGDIRRNSTLDTGIANLNSLSILAVYRLRSEGGATVAGNFTHHLDNVYNRDGGFSLWSPYARKNDKYENKSSYQSVTRKIEENESDNKYSIRMFDNLNNYHEGVVSNWMLGCLTIDSDSRSMQGFNSAFNNKTVNKYTNKLSDMSDRNDRDVSIKMFKTGEFRKASAHYGEVEIAELYVFDRALTEEEILKQYDMTKRFVRASKGIII